MLQVNLEDVLAVQKQRQLWNTTPLQDIEFVYKGEIIDLASLESGDFYNIAEWLYTGLNNFDFMLMLSKEIGIK